MAKAKTKKLALKPPLNPQQEMFCQYYVKNKETYGNAAWSYAEAYGYKLHEEDKQEKEVIDPLTKEVDYKRSDYDKALQVCSSAGGQLLRNIEVDKRIKALLVELLNDTDVDSELARAIKQDHKWEVKVKAISEYNKLKKRTEERNVTINFSLSDLLDDATDKDKTSGHSDNPKVA